MPRSDRLLRPVELLTGSLLMLPYMWALPAPLRSLRTHILVVDSELTHNLVPFSHAYCIKALSLAVNRREKNHRAISPIYLEYCQPTPTWRNVVMYGILACNK
jgi:hypothetical protein